AALEREAAALAAQHPGLPEAHAFLGLARALVGYAKADALDRVKLLRQAAESFRKGLELAEQAPASPDRHDALGLLRERASLTCIQIANYALARPEKEQAIREAERHADALCKLDPDRPEALDVKGCVLE